MFIWFSKFPVDTDIFFAQKLDRSFHLYINYQSLTIKNYWIPLPLISKTLEKLGWAKYFTQLNLTNTYHKIRIQESNEWKTAFYIRYSHFEYQVMFFKLSNTVTSFQDYINKIHTKKLDVFIIVYLNNILIKTKVSDQLHVEIVYSILD